MKRKRANILVKVLITLCIIVGIFAGGYFFLDKVIVPRYFASYGINGMGDLVGVVMSLYKSPKESTLVTNPYSQEDYSSAIKKLQDAGYQIGDDATIKEEDFEKFKGTEPVPLTDREFAAVCNKLIENGLLSDVLPKLNYLNVMNITALEFKVTPDKTKVYEDGGYSAANISFIIKIDTTDIREQIAKQMNTPIFLLNMIIPNTLYFSVNYDVDLTAEQGRANGSIAINGRTEQQSKVLIDLLIEFIFPEEDQMDKEGFTNAIGDIIVQGVDVFGDFKFIDNAGKLKSQNGILIIP